MKPEASMNVPESAAKWALLSRWERAELGRALRRLGWSYGEIMRVIPVPKGTLANWCREIDLSADQKQAIIDRTGSRRGVPRDTQRKRRVETDRIQIEASDFALAHMDDPFWVAGTVMYWAEGNKVGRGRRLGLANSDPRALRLFVEWTRRYHSAEAEFVLKLNLHEGNDEAAARHFWETTLGLPGVEFHRTYIKPEGTGHRKNHLAQGVCLARVRRSTDAWIRTLAWIDSLAGEWRLERLLTSPPGR